MAEREDRLGLCGERLGDYKIRSVLGSGGFGVVYQAVNVPLQRPVALKVLSPHKSNVTETLFKRFLREARLLARISHPNIAAIYRVGQEDRYCFIEMELVEGHSLARFVSEKGGRLETNTALQIGVQVADALAVAHEQAGVVHRDLKPSNVLIRSDEKVKLIDFGLAKPVLGQDSMHLTVSGTFVGTPSYASPEQARGEKPDHRSDLYSFGGVLYFMLTGRPPFPAGPEDSPLSVLHRIATTSPPSLDEQVEDVDERVSTSVMRLLASKPEDRPQTAGEASQELKSLLEARSGAEVPAVAGAGASGKPATWLKGAVAAAVAVVLAIGAMLLWPRRTPEPPSAEAPAVESAPAVPQELPATEGGRSTTSTDSTQSTQFGGSGKPDHEVAQQPAAAGADDPGSAEGTRLPEEPVEEETDPDNIQAFAPGASTGLEADPEGTGRESHTDARKPSEETPQTTAPEPSETEEGESEESSDLPNAEQARELQKRVAERLGVPVKREFRLSPQESITFVLIPPGRFMMGSPPDEPGHNSNEYRHPVVITHPFYMSATEVTEAQYEAVMGQNPGLAQKPDHPVVMVSWEDAVEFCRRVSQKGKVNCRLPTEAQWEWACRAGTSTPFFFGDDSPESDIYRQYVANDKPHNTVPVAQAKPNAWGLYDMHGNVMEWCRDVYAEDYYKHSPLQDPTGPEPPEHGNAQRVIRSMSYSAWGTRSAMRARGSQNMSGNDKGFRVVLLPGR